MNLNRKLSDRALAENMTYEGNDNIYNEFEYHLKDMKDMKKTSFIDQNNSNHVK